MDSKYTKLDSRQLDNIPYVKIGKPIKTKMKTKKKTKIGEKTKKYGKEIVEKYQENLSLINRNREWGEKHRITPKNWNLSNRKSYSGWIDKTFSKYRIKKQLNNFDEEEEENLNQSVQLFIHQKFLKDYLQPSSPYRGLILYHGLGSGKSCSSISIAEGLKNDYPIYVITPKSLQLNYKNELKKCGSVLYQINQYWEFVGIDIANVKEIGYLEQELNISKKILKLHGGFWINNMDLDTNYNTLTDIQQKQINTQIDNQIEKNYTFISNGMRLAKLNELSAKSNGGNLFNNSLVIIDEVHNLISTIVNNRPKGLRLYELLLEAKNVKIVLLTGTPIINYPHEVAIISNILRGLIVEYTIKLSKTKGVWNEPEVEQIIQDTTTIDQYIIEAGNNIIKITRTPPKFTNHLQNNKYNGVLYHNNELENKEWLEMITDNFKKHNYHVSGKIIQQNYKALPDERDEFNKFFIDKETNNVKNHILFKKRISGLVSYYSGASQDLYPSINQIHLENVPLSDYQFQKYEEGRKIERELEKPTKYKKKNDTMSSFYRVFSRMIANFVFPEKIYRPLSKKTIDLDNIEQHSISSDDEDIGEMDIGTLKLKAWTDLVKYKNRYLTMNSLETYSPKINKMIQNIHTSPGNIFIYSQFKTLEGINTIALALSVNGYAPFRLIKDDDGDYIEHFETPGDIDKPKYAIFDGSDEEKDLIIKIFNNNLQGLPIKLKTSLIERGNNLRGGLLKVLFATSSGAEGIHLENIRQVHITEPYWNPIRIQQVIGRAVRYKSHVNLPLIDRNVDIFIYIATLTKEQIEKGSESLRKKDTNPIVIKGDYQLPEILDPRIYSCFTSDQSIYHIAYKKEKITNQFFMLMKEGAVDCNLNSIQNEDIECFNYGSNVSKEDYSYVPNIRLDEGSAYIQKQQKLTEIKGKKILYKKNLYILGDDGSVYDYECWVGDDGRGARPYLVGFKEDKKIIFL